MVSTRSDPSLTHHFATAAEGTQLSYYSIGNGPDIVIVHGAMSFALTHKDLAVALSPYFTVNIFSRRNRGLSGPFPPSITDSSAALCTDRCNPSEDNTTRIANRTVPRTYNLSFSSSVLQTEVSDLHTILEATSSRFVISISSGAFITLSYLLSHSSPSKCLIKKAILFEPAVQFSDLDTSSQLADASGGLLKYEERRAAGDIIGALVAALKATGMVPGWMPEWLIRVIMNWKAARGGGSQSKQEEGDEGVTNPLKLAEALRYDFCVGEAMVGGSERFKEIQGVEVLLMGGTESQGYLKEGMDALEGLIEGSKRVMIQGIAHDGLGQKERGGRPERAAGATQEFFGGTKWE
ncbi:Alpha/Beta hydrolase protein [Immersiella caudata]|uniref:Alpha/Beta hydrolase protein n=1 Tax=Immersiella caudata TaxID=314043 RepID=A0AA39XIV3_9PEZI|nr:Alpha/Beta hydrolase protein [Immersiella caudata]